MNTDERTDYSALVAHSAEESGCFSSDATKKFGLKINMQKTEVLHQPNSTRIREEDIMVDGNWFWNKSTPEALYQVLDALTTKYRGG